MSKKVLILSSGPWRGGNSDSQWKDTCHGCLVRWREKRQSGFGGSI